MKKKDQIKEAIEAVAAVTGEAVDGIAKAMAEVGLGQRHHDAIAEMGREAAKLVEAEKERVGVNGPEAHVSVVEPEGRNGQPSRVLLRCAGVDYDVLAWKRSDKGIPVMVRANPKYGDGSGCAHEGYLDPDADFVQVIALRRHRNIGHLARLHVSLTTDVYVPPPPPAPPTRAELVVAEREARELLDEMEGAR